MNHYLLTPGPVASPTEVLRAQSKPLIGHRGARFSELFLNIENKLKTLLDTDQPIVVIPSSGTGALECLTTNFITAKTHVLSVSCGVFGDRFRKIAALTGATIVPVDVPMGEGVSPALVAEAVAAHPECTVLLLTQNETSTAVVNPIDQIIAALPETNRPLVLVDGVSSVGAMPCFPQKWGVDGLAFASQKGLLTPPGLGLVWLSPKGWNAIKDIPCPSYYFDLKIQLKELDSPAPANPYTPPVSLFYALDEALDEILADGLDTWFAARKRYARAFAAGLESLGFDMLVQKADDRSPGVTAVKLKNAPIKEVSKQLAAMGLEVAGGQGKLKGEIIRIAHYNDFRWPELCLVLGSLYAAMGEARPANGDFIAQAWKTWNEGTK